jgi:hypothetical protein
MTEFCGVGGSNAPVPGDPSLSSSVITAQAGDGGIAVSWTYPVVNPNALAYTELYRSTTSDFALASIIAQVGGSYHFDALYDETGTQYFYWIVMVAFSGTRGDTMGPASATMQPTTARMVELLEGVITNTELAQALKTDITGIAGVQSGLSTEAQLRVSGTTILTDMLSGLDSQLDAQGYLIVNETAARTLNDSNVIASIDAKYVIYDNAFAGIATEQLLQTGRNTTYTAYAGQITTLQATTTGPNGHSAKIQETQEVLVGADGTSGVAANYMLKTSVSAAGQPALIAGFGLYNDGATSDFIISADKFAIGKPGQTDSYPFIIAAVNGVTQIALNARTLIPDAHITNAMIDNYIQSSNFNPTTGTGWRIDKAGNIEGNNIILRDNSGNVLFSAGGLAGNIPLSDLTSSNLSNSNTTWADVAGTTNAPANNADVTGDNTAAGFTGQGALAVLNTVAYGSLATPLAELIDGKVEQHYGSIDPQGAWTTDAIKTEHLKDLWYDTTNKALYVYQAGFAGYFSWSIIEDQAAIDAADAASDAQDTADGKRRVFTTTPVAPYDVGDLWDRGSGAGGGIWRCVTPVNVMQFYNVGHWQVVADTTSTGTAANFTGQGSFATLNKILGVNISTYIEAAAIDTAFIKNLAVGTVKIDHQAVTIPDSGGGSVGVDFTTSPETLATMSFTSSGAPIFINASSFVKNSRSDRGCSFYYRLYRGPTKLVEHNIMITAVDISSGAGSCASISYLDNPGAGIHVYRLKAVRQSLQAGQVITAAENWITGLEVKK